MNAVVSSHAVVAGAYLTDGRNLFRVRTADRDEGGLAEVEDCRTLAIYAYTIEELADMRLVKPAPAGLD